MANPDLDRQLLGDDSEDEQLESEEREQDQPSQEGMESQENEDEYDREEREEDAKLLDEVEAALDAEEAAAANSEGDEEGEGQGDKETRRGGDKEMGEGAEGAETTPAAAEQAAHSTSSGQAHSTDSAPSMNSGQAGSPQAELSTQHSELSTTHSSPLAKRDTRALARRENGLSESQHRALAMLAQGLTIPQAAVKAGIGRATLYRWTKFDARFRAAYNTWKQEQRESCRAALLKCADAAVARIAQRVEVDEDLAFKVVKELGLFKDSEESATIDPQLVRHEIEIQTLATERNLQREHFFALCAKSGITEEQAKDYFDWKKQEEGAVPPALRPDGEGERKGQPSAGTMEAGQDDEEDLEDEDEDAEAEDQEDSETDETGVSQVPGLGALAQLLMRQGLKGNQ